MQHAQTKTQERAVFFDPFQSKRRRPGNGPFTPYFRTDAGQVAARHAAEPSKKPDMDKE